MVDYVNDYYNDPAISQSQLKLLLGNPSVFNTVKEPELYFEEKKHFVIGSAVDCLLTQSKEEFDRTYHVSKLENKPTDVVKSIINKVYDFVLAVAKQEGIEVHNITFIGYKALIIQACHDHNYQNRQYDDTKWAKICEHYQYWDELRNSEGKIILSEEEDSLISQIVMSLRTNEATLKYFNSKGDIHYQKAIYFDYEGVACKALLDMIIIDYDNKTIQPIDIKTLGDYTINFPKSLRQRRYDIQAAFYTEALKHAFPGFTILPFKFLVESTIQPGTPLVFTCHPSLLYIGEYGRPLTFTKQYVAASGIGYVEVRHEEIKGFRQLLSLYKYYHENGFEKDKKIVESGHELMMDWSGIMN